MFIPSFPDLREEPDGPQVFFGEELDVGWLIGAYRRGFFPWPDENHELNWWCPLERMVFSPQTYRPSRRLVRSLRQGNWQVSLDRSFQEVIETCANIPRPGHGEETWITPQLQELYQDLHHRGVAHSVEVRREGRLVGGLYGLSLGSIFFGESMFSLEPNGSKVALSVILAHLRDRGFDLFDAQVENAHLVSLGGEFMARGTFLDRLEGCLQKETRLGPWQMAQDYAQKAYPPGA
ncbi:MAG: leucyl/phenylalanyl-tRNA--protein transferase [Planctomycetota bacterium]|nr:leucyl/phenylalanyl-tRNA--protein transferase [Planctomycetota bacterium]